MKYFFQQYIYVKCGKFGTTCEYSYKYCFNKYDFSHCFSECIGI